MKNVDKSKKIILGLSVVILALIVVFVGQSLATSKTQSKTMKVDGLSFENASVIYNGELSSFEVDVYNENKKEYKMKSIDVILKNADGDKITLNYKLDGLDADEGRKIIFDKVAYDLSGYSKISYKINK